MANSTTDLNALAIEALDLWQEHLAKLAADPAAKSGLADMMEPSRQLFAAWMEKAQNATHVSPNFVTPTTTAAAHGAASAPAAPAAGTLSLAQLALHVAELEKRVAKLEAWPKRKPNPAARKTAKTSGGDGR